MKRSIIAFLLLVACAHSDVVSRNEPASSAGADGWSAIALDARAAALSASDPAPQIGSLQFRGGLELKSTDPRFGGISGISIEPDGSFIAVSDAGYWVSGRLALDASGRLAGVEGGKIAALRDARGAVLSPKENADAEEVARLPDGRYAVSFERTHLVRIYALQEKGPAAAAESELALGGAEGLEANGSLEAMAVFDDKLLIGAESPDAGKAPPFWITSPTPDTKPDPAGRSVVRDGFGLVSLARLPDGDFLAMERFFSPLTGIQIHLRRVSLEGLGKEEPKWEGAAIADLAPPLAVDNFEALSVLPAADGSVRLYIVSDDNYNAAQRTLIYAFDMKP